jgi:uncharacterized membrane protein YbhN (UPF0104 family)
MSIPIPMSTALPTATRPTTARSWFRPPTRHRLAAVIFVALAAAAGWILLTQADLIAASVASVRSADGRLLLAAIALVSLRYVAAAVSLQAATPHPLPFAGTLAVQLATAVVGRVTPEAVGWLVLNVRFLGKVGLEVGSATAAIAVKLAAGAIGRLGFAAVVAWSVTGAGSSPVSLDLELPIDVGPWALGLGLLGVGALAFAMRRSERARTTIEPALRDLAALRGDPGRAARLGGSTLLLSVLPAMTLAASAAAVGLAIPLMTVFAIYLVGSALAAASPTPGNLGALEVTLSAGLTGAGAGASDALAAVLLYRLVTFWLPILPGLVAFRVAQRSGYL